MNSDTARLAAPIPIGGGGGLTVCLAVYCALFLTNLDIFLSERGISPVGTLAVFMAACVFYLGSQIMVAGVREVYGQLEATVQDALAPLIAFLLYVVISISMATAAPIQTESVELTQIFPIFQFAVLCFGAALVASTPARLAFGPALRFAILVLGGSIIYETLAPGALGTESIRSGGFALNANVGAFLITGMLAMSLDFQRFRLSDGAFILVAAIAVFCTLSRGGLAQLFILCVVFTAIHGRRALAEGRWRLLGGIALAAGTLVVLMISLGKLANDAPAAVNREFSDRIAQLTFQGANLTDDPYRGVLARYYLDLILQHPYIGFGTGTALDTVVPGAPFGKGPHNIYLRIWLDTGILGLFTYVGFLAALLAHGLRRRSVKGVLLGVMVVAYGFFDHNVIDNKAILLLVGASLAPTALLHGRVT